MRRSTNFFSISRKELTIAGHVSHLVVGGLKTSSVGEESVAARQVGNSVGAEEEDILGAVVGLVDGLSDRHDLEALVDDGDVAVIVVLSGFEQRFVWTDDLQDRLGIIDVTCWTVDFRWTCRADLGFLM